MSVVARVVEFLDGFVVFSEVPIRETFLELESKFSKGHGELLSPFFFTCFTFLP